MACRGSTSSQPQTCGLWWHGPGQHLLSPGLGSLGVPDATPRASKGQHSGSMEGSPAPTASPSPQNPWAVPLPLSAWALSPFLLHSSPPGTPPHGSSAGPTPLSSLAAWPRPRGDFPDPLPICSSPSLHFQLDRSVCYCRPCSRPDPCPYAPGMVPAPTRGGLSIPVSEQGDRRGHRHP